MVSNAAPESARWPRWIRCQSVMQPSDAEYWHIGAITMRFASVRPPMRKGSNNFGPVMAARSQGCGLPRQVRQQARVDLDPVPQISEPQVLVLRVLVVVIVGDTDASHRNVQLIHDVGHAGDRPRDW